MSDPTKPHPHVGYRSNLCELCKRDSRHDIHRDPHAIDMSQSPGPRPDAGRHRQMFPPVAVKDESLMTPTERIEMERARRNFGKRQ